MAAGFDVVWSSAAVADLEQLIDFIAARSPANAVHVFNAIRKRALTLQRFPKRGRAVPELKVLRLDSYRELIIKSYRLLFRIDKKTVFVLGVFDGRRDLEEVLFDRLTR